MFNRVSYTVSTIKDFYSNPLAALSGLQRGLASHDTAPDKKLAQRLLVAYKRAKDGQKDIAPEYRAEAGEWGWQIYSRRADYMEALRNEDVAVLSELLMNFFRNSGVTSLYTYASYNELVDSGRLHKMWFVNCILHDYKIWRGLHGETQTRDLESPAVGNPWGYALDGTLITPVSCFHNYYANTVKNLLSGHVKPTVAEIGGGFGGFAYYLMRKGEYRYINFDIPEVLLIAQYYLIKAFPDKKVLLFAEGANFDDYDIILMPNFELPRMPSGYADLFINTRSLSEMGYRTIEEYLKYIARACRGYFLHENSSVAVKSIDTFTETPAQDFPIPDCFKMVYKRKAAWKAGGGRYWSYLYQKNDK